MCWLPKSLRSSFIILYALLLLLVLLPGATALESYASSEAVVAHRGEQVQLRPLDVRNNHIQDGGHIQVRVEPSLEGFQPYVMNNDQWMEYQDRTHFYIQVSIPEDAAYGEYSVYFELLYRQNEQAQNYEFDSNGRLHLRVVPASPSQGSSGWVGPVMGGLLLGLLIYLGEKRYFLLSAFGILPAHWRLESDEVLENRGRTKVFELVRAKDGISLGQLVKDTGMSKSTVRYALRVLLAFNYIIQGPNRYYYLPGRNISHLTNTQAEIIHRLETKEMYRQEELARAVGLTRAGLSHQMAILIKRGDIERIKKGRYVYYRPNTKMDKPDHWWEASGQ